MRSLGGRKENSQEKKKTLKLSNEAQAIKNEAQSKKNMRLG
jgi:hypothetical protein